MTNDTIKTIRLTLNNSPYCGKITVSMEAFFDFSFEMAEELEDLVAQHKLANPAQLKHRIGHRSANAFDR